MLKDQPPSLKMKKKAKLVSEENCYEKVKLIGQGTFGKVFLAKHKKENKLYAIKQVLQDPRYKNRQLSIISRIDHENIVYMLDYYIKIVNDDYYLNIVMDYFPTCLSNLLKEKRKNKKPISPKTRKIFAFQIFKALYYMQLNNICHRDLKPPNILLNQKTLQLKICDFGSAKIIEKKEKNVAYICSRYYRAPQLILGSTSYGMEIDVWSAGCILVQFLTLQAIFPGDSSVQQLIEIMKILGTPPQKMISYFQEVNMTSLPLPKIKPNEWDKILKKYNPQPQLIDLISQILTFDTEKRLKPLEILTHPYFQDIKEYKKEIVQLPLLLNFTSLANRKNSKQIKILNKIYNEETQVKLKDSNQLTLKSHKMQLQMELSKEDNISTKTPETVKQEIGQLQQTFQFDNKQKPQKDGQQLSLIQPQKHFIEPPSQIMQLQNQQPSDF